MVAAPQVLEQYLVQSLGQDVIPEISNCIEQIKICEPDMGKLFWRSLDVAPALYIILQGKVRIIDRHDNLVISLSAGESFGELTVFADADFQSYSTRVANNTKLGCLSTDLIISLVEKQRGIKEHLYQLAKRKDLLLLNYQDQSDRTQINNLHQILPWLENYQLEIGTMPKLVLQEDFFWLRQGEIVHSSGEKLIPGKTYISNNLPKTGEWKITREVDLYCFSQASVKQQSQNKSTNSPDLDIAKLFYSPLLKSNPALSNEDIFDDYTPGETTPIEIVTKKNSQTKAKTPTKKTVTKSYFPSPTVQVSHLWQRFSQRYPFFLQQSASDCGAACLVMLGRYWGKRFSINRLRSMANVDRSGATLKGLADAAEGIGFTARMVTATLSTLTEQNLPAIAHWEGKHYIVVYKITSSHVIVADPAIGQLTLSHEKFEQGWDWLYFVVATQRTVEKS